MRVFYCLLLFFSAGGFCGDFRIDAEQHPLDSKIVNRDCILRGTSVFTSDAGRTKITDDRAYSGTKSIKMTIKEGSKGFGSFGGIINFNNCFQDKPKLIKGDEVWVRLRIFLPEDFEFNINGRNKFLRFRTYHMEGGEKVSDGYNDLYLDAHNLEKVFSTPFDFIYEGRGKWYQFGKPTDFLDKGQWETVELYLKLDDKTRSEGGNPAMRFWKNGKLIGESYERATLKSAESFVAALYLFTYWDNKGAHKTQSLYVDDLLLTTNFPNDFDENGYRYIGMGIGNTSPWQTMVCPVK